MVYLILIIPFVIVLFHFMYSQLTNINVEYYKQLNENKQLKFESKIFRKAVEQAVEDLIGEFSSEHCIQDKDCEYEDKSCSDCMYDYFFEMVDTESYWIKRKYEGERE